jgi:septum formation protein
MNKKIILASASPRRRELLAQIGLEFEVKVSNKEEVYTSTKPQKIVEELALMKENVASDLQAEGVELKNTIVIGADTIVVRNEEILGKPKDEEHAYEILLSLQGRAHEVYTGVAILSYNNTGEKEIINHAVETKVHVHEMSEEEIRAYIATGDPMDKAGAYGIQGSFAAYIDGIEGDYYNVVGLPVSYVYQQLKKR